MVSQSLQGSSAARQALSIVPDGLCRRLRLRGVASCAVVLNDDFTSRSTAELPPTIARSTPKRQREFLAGRFCAERALQELYGTGPVGVDADRVPMWPRGFVGSITHSGPLAWSAAAVESEIAGLGIDSEHIPNADACREVTQVITRVSEWDSLVSRSAFDPCALVTLVFSAKESAYKALFPLTRTFLEFTDVEAMHVHPARGTFCVRLLRDAGPDFPAGTRLDGEFELAGDFVHTAVILDR